MRGLCHNEIMVIENHTIISQLRTQIARTDMRLRTYARHYEAFRAYGDCSDSADRELQVSIAYLYHTSLSILEQRKESLEQYCDDVRGVLASFEDMVDVEQQRVLREELLSECQAEVSTLSEELRDIDEGVALARRHEHELLTDE